MDERDRVAGLVGASGPLTELDRYALREMAARGACLEDAASDLNRAADKIERFAVEAGISLRRLANRRHGMRRPT